ncbi:hypothetical protein HPB50_003332 [Hyalomma asiaticum]|uniref:Uncharacterized protein n=1 Tax=Hyalomma asiaticum TaxID=266040 RepID=A0ACB7S388_HYAAI|nr:hypothetical protein HPB50_003332 [Hyalomma asiaticum]
MDVAETEDAARGTEEIAKRTEMLESSTASTGVDPKGDELVDQQTAGNTSGAAENQASAPDFPASVGGATLRRDPPVSPAVACDPTGPTATAPGSSSASKIDDPKGPNALNQEKGGVRTQTGVSAAGKRRFPKTSTDSESASVSGVEEPPAKVPHGRRSSLRPRPSISADKRAGKTESLDEGQSLVPDGSGGAGGVKPRARRET